MAIPPEVSVYLERSRENLAAAESEFWQGRFNTSASRAYYAAFLAAVAMLLHAGVPQPTGGRIWDHGFVQAEFVRRFIHRRKLYPAEYAAVLDNLMERRHRADYRLTPVSRRQADRSRSDARRFVERIIDVIRDERGEGP
ncbi:MAG TPA: HEPN domain-containing protein [Dehalococcoidia bacterium]|nr:HEPN domain-containing protein [Dehalococcoidia bacterium]